MGGVSFAKKDENPVFIRPQEAEREPKQNRFAGIRIAGALIISPRGSVKLRFRSACTSSKLIETLRNSIAGVFSVFMFNQARQRPLLLFSFRDDRRIGTAVRFIELHFRQPLRLEELEQFAIACTGLWRELFTRARFLIRQSHEQGD